ncbi:MAG: hypothetical protein N2484_07820 [Clostridia bacterium]|nr:hypothetical protein [Clostridia bacterium]
MNEIKNCKRCGKPFFSSGFGDIFCKACGEEEQRLYKEMRDFLIDHPGTNAFELSKIFKIRVDRITRYIEDNRLSPP